MHIGTDIPLAPRTTFRIGGPARYFCAGSDDDDIVRALAWADERHLPVHVLGGGSNILVADDGVSALVVSCSLARVWADGTGRVVADAACPWDTVVGYAVAHGLAGIECLSGIPGTAGAAPVQNIGAYGQQVADVIESVDAIDRVSGRPLRLNAPECGFSYRSSIFNRALSDRYVITRIRLQLRPGGRSSYTHPDLAPLPSDAPLSAVRAVVLDVRERKGMLRTPGRRGHASAGSFFKNPLIHGAAPDGAPSWTMPDGMTKISAAWLIEHAGMRKGTREGGALISPDHALSIISDGTATAAHVVALASRIQGAVRDAFGVLLEPEVLLWGFDEYPLVR